ncbi:MAG: TIR domain-containing protein [Planctomycetaceae bacterium]|nr:TIR domain-containing protein [Planctomycetaceae bacterium]MCA9042889.1 TIR domain-containing protein [Planctomycetaceae bacterium]MCB9953712.1 TIR domain-containing protein [Planctomycetaceae bacterium]
MIDPHDKYDVFLSHNSSDKPVVERIAELLKEAGIRSFLDKADLNSGLAWQGELAEAIKQSGATAIFYGPSGEGKWQQEERRMALSKAVNTNDHFRVFAVLLPGGESEQIDPFLKQRTWVDLSAGLNDIAAWDRLVSAIRPDLKHSSSGEAKAAAITNPSPLRFLLDRICPGIHRWLTVTVRVFEEPPEWRVLNQYLRTLSSSIAQEISEKTYVPLNAKDLISGDKVLHTRRSGFLTPIHQLIKEVVGISEGGDALSAQISAVSKKSRVVRNIVSRLSTAEEPLVLLGDPGSGKSLTLKQAAMLIAEKESCRIFPKVCIFVRLGEFHEQSPDERSVFQYLKRTVPTEIAPYLERLDAAGRLVIFFDGMDEMSRQQYTQHTRALSIFAGSRKGQTQTLFSCRVTDFTPEFKHNRLVLLPFDVPQIYKYVTRQIPHFPVKIDGESWTARQLSRRLAAPDLPMQASNPFVLWLFCFYLLEHEKWPASRVELLSYYNELNWRRKDAEAKREGHAELPDQKQAFLTWGKIAFTITNRNQGTVIPVDDLQQLLNEQELEHLDSGKFCGIFQESLDLQQTLIRFEHHRFQEYFTAFYIKECGLQLDWLDKLDAPRWQETLVNLVLSGGRSEALSVLGDEISKTIDQLDSLDWHELERRLRAFDLHDRMLLSDRIELASRILKQSPSTTSDGYQQLTDSFRDAVYWVSECGNPVEQVRMLEAAQNVSEVDAFRVAKTPLEGHVSWARNQALIVTASAKGASSHALPLDVLMSFSGGTFLNRLNDYFRIATTLKQRRFWFVLIVGILLMCCQIAAVSSMVFGTRALLTAYLQSRISEEQEAAIVQYVILTNEASLQDEPEPTRTIPLEPTELILIGDELMTRQERLESLKSSLAPTLAHRNAVDMLNSNSFALSLFTVLVVVVVVHCFTSSEHLSRNLLLVGAIYLSLPLIGYLLWSGLLLYALGAFFLLLNTGLSLGFAACIVTYGAHVTILVLFAKTASFWMSERPPLHALRKNVWDQCGFGPWASFTAYYGAFVMLGLGLPYLVARLPASVHSSVANWGLFPYFNNDVINELFSLVVYSIATVVAGLLVYRVITRSSSRQRIDDTIVSFVSFSIGPILVIMAFSAAAMLDSRGSFVGPVLFAAVSIVTSSVLAVLIFWVLRKLLRMLLEQRTAMLSMTPEQWREKICSGSSSAQDEVLRRTSHESVGLPVEEFLAAMVEVEDDIKTEPALSTYWSKRAGLEQILRQHRTG